MKKRIALYATGWNGENLDIFIEGIRKVMSEDEYDLFIFTSYATYSLNEKEREAENMIYNLLDAELFDGAIIFGSGLNSEAALNNIMSRYIEADVPFVIQGDTREGASTVTVDNYSGMKDLCCHIIEDHNVKRAVFIAGPKDNDDSNTRLLAFKDALAINNIDDSEVDVLYANWERSHIEEYINANYVGHFDKLPDAFVCANDPMALFTLTILEANGIVVPRDVIVTGFDNINDGRIYYPSIASVDQRYFDQGSESAKILIEHINGKKEIDNKVLPCLAIHGESCGCINCKNEIEARRKLCHDSLYNRFKDESKRGRESHIEMCIMSCSDYRRIPQKFKEDMFTTQGEEGDDFHIIVNPEYVKLVYADQDNVNDIMQGFSPVMDVLASKTYGNVNPDTQFDRKNMFPGYTGEGTSSTFVYTSIRIGANCIGFVAMTYSQGGFDGKKFNDFGGRINKILEIYQMNIKLTLLNDKLSELLQKDSLTNVKNRIAYDNYIQKMDDEILHEGNVRVSVIMCDINNLKTINDNLGHDAGDIYIKNCCKLMCESFKCSPIFRTGGDEFVIVISTADYDTRNEKLAEMRKKMDEINNKEMSPLEKVSIATGIADLDVTKDKSLANTVKRADAFMYINKAEIKARML